jgi:hypothetical protein
MFDLEVTKCFKKQLEVEIVVNGSNKQKDRAVGIPKLYLTCIKREEKL